MNIEGMPLKPKWTQAERDIYLLGLESAMIEVLRTKHDGKATMRHEPAREAIWQHAQRAIEFFNAHPSN